jgi:prophage antirepressor-like protein
MLRVLFIFEAVMYKMALRSDKAKTEAFKN